MIARDASHKLDTLRVTSDHEYVPGQLLRELEGLSSLLRTFRDDIQDSQWDRPSDNDSEGIIRLERRAYELTLTFLSISTSLLITKNGEQVFSCDIFDYQREASPKEAFNNLEAIINESARLVRTGDKHSGSTDEPDAVQCAYGNDLHPWNILLAALCETNGYSSISFPTVQNELVVTDLNADIVPHSDLGKIATLVPRLLHLDASHSIAEDSTPHFTISSITEEYADDFTSDPVERMHTIKWAKDLGIL